MYEAGGGTAIYARSPLERRFRDIHTAKAHMMISPASLELGGPHPARPRDGHLAALAPLAELLHRRGELVQPGLRGLA